MECLLNKDFSNACNKLRSLKNNSGLNKIEVNALRNLSIKAGTSIKTTEDKKEIKEEVVVKREISPKEQVKYERLFTHLHMCLANNDFEQGYYTFNRLLILQSKLGISDTRLDIIRDLFLCFNFIVEHPELDLNSYTTDFEYNSNDREQDFYLAINRNDYINALELCNEINLRNVNEEFDVYKILLERIFNFLNIRSIIKGQAPHMHHARDNSFVGLVGNKKYKEALGLVQAINMDSHDKNILTSLLEGIVDIDNIAV